MATEEPGIRVRVLLFSMLREQMGADSLEVALPQGATGADLLDRLEPIAPYRRHLRLAVNHRYTTESAALADGDEVALITPVSGG